MPAAPPGRQSAELELAGVERLLIDGNNLLHRMAGIPDRNAQRRLIARLRAALPATVATTLVLDGTPDPGGPLATKITRSLEVRHAGPQGADALIVTLVRGRPFAARSRTFVVTDDRALGDRIRTVGGAVRRLAWLQSLLGAPERPAAAVSRLGAGVPAAGASREARPPRKADEPGNADEPENADEPDVAPWKPGRGATRKRGNPRRSGRKPAR